MLNINNYLDFISSVGKSPKPHGMSVDPRISPNINPNSRDKSIPRIRLSKPALTRDRSDIIVPNVIDITGPMSGDTSMAATMFEALFSTRPNAARELFRMEGR